MSFNIGTIKQRFYVSFSALKKGVIGQSEGWLILSTSKSEDWTEATILDINEKCLQWINYFPPVPETPRDFVVIREIIPLDVYLDKAK